MIRRPPRSTLSSSSAASDVYKRQQLEEAHVECDVVPDQDGVLTEAREGGKDLLDGGLALNELGRDPVDADGCRRDRLSGIDELIERLLPQQPPIDDSHGPERDDLVLGWVEARRLRVEHRVGELVQAPLVPFGAVLGRSEEVEVVE